MPLIPYVIEKSGREERAMDIYSRLLKDRIVFLGSAINDEVANAIVAQLLFLQSDDPKADIHLYLNSPGGSVSAGLAIYDTMQFVTCDVCTYCIGQCASMGAVLLSSGLSRGTFAPTAIVKNVVYPHLLNILFKKVTASDEAERFGKVKWLAESIGRDDFAHADMFASVALARMGSPAEWDDEEPT